MKIILAALIIVSAMLIRAFTVEEIPAVNEIIGVSSPSYETLRDEPHIFYPLEITLNNYAGAGGEEITHIINSRNDLPRHSVETRCPKGPQKINKCWFVKYVSIR